MQVCFKHTQSSHLLLRETKEQKKNGNLLSSKKGDSIVEEYLSRLETEMKYWAFHSSHTSAASRKEGECLFLRESSLISDEGRRAINIVLPWLLILV